jgi:hypothetical protein
VTYVNKATLEQLQEKSAQAYQVFGYLDELLAGGDAEKPSSNEMIRVLDYFCDEEGFDPQFLPWPRFTQKHMIADSYIDPFLDAAGKIWENVNHQIWRHDLLGVGYWPIWLRRLWLLTLPISLPLMIVLFILQVVIGIVWFCGGVALGIAFVMPLFLVAFTWRWLDSFWNDAPKVNHLKKRAQGLECECERD